jgi:hypothetical protein
MYLNVDPVVPIVPIVPHAVEPVTPVVPHVIAPVGPYLPRLAVDMPVVRSSVLPCAPPPVPSGASEAVLLLAIVGLGLIVWLVVQMIREWRA